jgi:formylglycine-generating enzyme required for sulfatase activity
MVFIPPGTFRMGSPEGEVDRGLLEGPQTDVILSRGFWISKYELTQGEYELVMGNNPSWFNGDRTAEVGEDYGTDLRRPVENVSWNDAIAYCAQLTARELGAERIPANSAYRLPTEAEWEYACRAWTSTRFSCGDDPDYAQLANYAWYSINSGGTTHPVGEKLPNQWGLYDMHGNVWEWCQDWLHAYRGGLALDPLGMAPGVNRVDRGGSWFVEAGYCRSAQRDGVTPEMSYNQFGFRIVLAPVQP